MRSNMMLCAAGNEEETQKGLPIYALGRDTVLHLLFCRVNHAL